MRYPVKFLKGQKRVVFVDGEAYFKVAKDKEHPFVVNAGEVAVEVLGTEFNISSYKEEHGVKTVLVEGSVSMSNSVVPGDKVLLKPGFEATWDKTARTTEVEEVDVDLYTGWTKGELIFMNSTFEDITKKLERRYNVTIQNNNMPLKDKMLNARFNVNVEHIGDVLESINEIQPFKYSITGQKITIE
jgi:ferric-dicitrate binding protein FerR (iron transport regulator)